MTEQLKADVSHPTSRVRDPQPWGSLEWIVSGEIGNSETLTVGTCRINPGEQNPPHYHPNCDEVLLVVSGRIRNRVDDDYQELGPGDAISIPSGAVHNAKNIGEEEVELTIVYNTASRLVVGE